MTFPFCSIFLRLISLLILALSLAWSSWALALPKEIEVDRLLLAVEDSISQQDWSRADARLVAVKALELDPPQSFFYFRGLVSTELNDFRKARHALERYVVMTGKDGEFYRDSLKLLNRIEGLEQAKIKQTLHASKSSQLVMNDGEHNQYIQRLKTLYLVEQARDALEMHINTLLSNHRYIPGRYRSDRQWKGSLYQIQVHQGEISILEKRADEQGGYRLNQDSVGVYGVNPYISVQCDSVGDQCWIHHPETGRQWLELESDRHAVETVAEAFTHLLRHMQGR